MTEEPSKKKRPIHRLAQFLWEDHDTRRWLSRWILGELRVFYFVVKGFAEHQCPLQASALTFVTLLAMVPLLALGFAMIKGLGVSTVLAGKPAAVATAVTTGSATVQRPGIAVTAAQDNQTTDTDKGAEENFIELLRDSLTTQLTADQKEVRDRIISYVKKTDFSALKAAGVIFLVVISISALGTMEHVFNQIWGLRRARTLLRKFTDYLSVVVICPLLFAAAMALTTKISRNALVAGWLRGGYVSDAAGLAIRLAPYLSVWIALTCLYLFLPNTRVKLRCALAGGFAAGVVWQLAFWCYTRLQAGMSAYNAVYSTLAALPFFLSWLYTSWLIVLFGAEVAAAYQNIETYARDRMTQTISPAERLRIGLNLLLTICARFRREESPWTADQLSRYLECPARLADELLADLAHAGMVMPVGTGRLPAYQPAVPLNNITPARVIEALQETESGGVLGTATPEAICARTIMEQWRHGLWRALGQVGFDVLVEEIRPTAWSAPVEHEK